MKKTLTMVLALVLVFALGVGGTLAWLTATAPEVKNTFTPSDINITLTESENLDLQMVPGHTITKDPKATVVAGSEDCYLFVKIEKSENYGTFLAEYEIADGWTKYEEGVYYRTVTASDKNQEFSVLKDNKVTVKDTVTKAQMEALTEATYPTLTFKAAAVQYYSTNDTPFAVEDAYAKIDWTTGTVNQ